MTARVVLSCDGQAGIHECRQAIPVGAVLTGRDARHTAKAEGWSAQQVGGRVLDLCPACTRRLVEGRQQLGGVA